MSSLLTRGPDGRYLGWGQQLTAWLPLLLDAPMVASALEVALDVMAKWCDRRAASEYDRAAQGLRNDWLNPQLHAEAREHDAHRWFVRRKALEAAREAVKNA